MSDVKAPSADTDARQFARALTELYGPALDRVVVFGFRALGDARPDADYEIAVFLRNIKNRRAEWNQTAGRFVAQMTGLTPIPE